MPDKEEKPQEVKKSGDESAAEGSNAQVQEAMDEEQEQGFRGQKVDPTPNENYTVEGVIAEKPTPETTLKEGERITQVTVTEGGELEGQPKTADKKASSSK